MDPRIHAGLDRETHCPPPDGPKTIGSMAAGTQGREPGSPPLVADLHVHYPMHVLSGDRERTLGRMTRVRSRPGLGDRLRSAVLWVASRLLNYRSWDSG